MIRPAYKALFDFHDPANHGKTLGEWLREKQEEGIAMTRYGTCHFPTLQHAYTYYSRQANYSLHSVAKMVEDGSISLGAPALKDGERLVLVDDGLRYAIEVGI